MRTIYRFMQGRGRLGLLGAALVMAACSGSGDSSSSSSGGGGTATTESLRSISSIPDLNIDSLDTASATNANIAVPKGLRKAVSNSSTEFSRPGCELRGCVEEFKSQVKEFNGNKCIMEAMEANTDFKVGDGDYNYFRVTMPEEAVLDVGGQERFRVKVGVVDDVLRLALCKEKTSAAQTMAVRYEIADGKFSGQITNIWPSFQQAGATDAFRITVDLATEDLSKLSVGDTGSLTGQFNGFWGAGQIALNIANESGTATNTVDASFQSGGDDAAWGKFTSIVFGEYNADEGCSTFSGSGTYPAWTVSDAFGSDIPSELTSAGYTASSQFCWKDADPTTATSIADWVEAAVNGQCTFNDTGTDCFSFATVNNALTAYVYATSLATYYDDIVSKTLGSFSAPSVSFTSDETWDCEAPSGQSFTAIDVTQNAALQSAMSACFVDLETASADRGINSCEELEREKDAESDTGETVTTD